MIKSPPLSYWLVDHQNVDEPTQGAHVIQLVHISDVTGPWAERIRQAQHAAGLQPTCSTAKSVLGLFLFNTVYWHWQGEMNKIWDRYPGAPTGTLVPLNA